MALVGSTVRVSISDAGRKKEEAHNISEHILEERGNRFYRLENKTVIVGLFDINIVHDLPINTKP